jgi:5S rRNA maturation endonuclease (ribonuclease M5)
LVGGSPKKSPLNFQTRTFSWAQQTHPQQQHIHTAKMPKSKRAKVVHLTKTDKKGKELSQKLFANVQEAADNFQHIFVFAVENMRNSYLKEVRAEFADSRYAQSSAQKFFF